jgi:hypothetical protein
MSMVKLPIPNVIYDLEYIGMLRSGYSPSIYSRICQRMHCVRLDASERYAGVCITDG